MTARTQQKRFELLVVVHDPWAGNIDCLVTYKSLHKVINAAEA